MGPRGPPGPQGRRGPPVSLLAPSLSLFLSFSLSLLDLG